MSQPPGIYVGHGRTEVLASGCGLDLEVSFRQFGIQSYLEIAPTHSLHEIALNESVDVTELKFNGGHDVVEAYYGYT